MLIQRLFLFGGVLFINAKSEKITRIPIQDLHPFPDHPFSVLNDEAMEDLVSSIKENGVLSPIIIRTNEEGNYEIVSGHRRVYACQLAGVETIPAMIRDCTREEAIILMVDSNLQRDHILPCEKGLALKMKVDALYHRGSKGKTQNEESCAQVGHNFGETEKSIDTVAKDIGSSRSQVQRLIRLTNLEPELQKLVNDEKMGITPAYELSFLSPEEQKWVIETIESESTTPSLSQAQKLKIRSNEKTLTEDMVLEIMSQQKKPEQQNITLKSSVVRQFFPKNTTDEQIMSVIIKLLESWFKHRQEKAKQKQSAPQQKTKNKNDPSL